jgi:hypothetical protein
MVTSERLVVNREKIVHETFDGEVIIINLDTGTYYNLVETGVDVWRGVEQGLAREALLDSLARHYSAERDAVAAVVNPFVDELVSEEIVILEPSNGDATARLQLDAPANGRAFTPPALSRFTNMSDLLLLDPIHDVDEHGWPSRRSD